MFAFSTDKSGTTVMADNRLLASYVLVTKDAKVPTRATNGSAGYDVYSPSDVVIKAHTTIRINLGIKIMPPVGHYARTSCRSSFATKHQVLCPADVIDPDYTGCIHMCLTNLSASDFKVNKHDRVGSIVFEKYAADVTWKKVPMLPVTVRGCNGFGSTGN